MLCVEIFNEPKNCSGADLDVLADPELLEEDWDWRVVPEMLVL